MLLLLLFYEIESADMCKMENNFSMVLIDFLLNPPLISPKPGLSIRSFCV